MALPGLLIEYLVCGAIALAWLWPLLQASLPKIDPTLLPVALLLLYVLGMAVDFLAFFLTLLPKRWIRSRVARRYLGTALGNQKSGTLRQAKIALYAPELAKELATRSSRDRIARGSLLNAILATIFFLPWKFGVLLVLFSLVLWAGFEQLSYGYELCAEKVLDEKLEREALKSST